MSIPQRIVGLQAGERFLINVGETCFTLSLAKYEELTKIMETYVETREDYEGCRLYKAWAGCRAFAAQ